MKINISSAFFFGILAFVFSSPAFSATAEQTAGLQADAAPEAASASAYADLQRQLTDANRNIEDLKAQVEELQSARISPQVPYDVLDLRSEVRRLKREADRQQNLLYIAIAGFIFLGFRDSGRFKGLFGSKKKDTDDSAAS